MRLSASISPQRGSTLVPASSHIVYPDIRSVVQLVDAHACKVYFSGPLIHRVERQPNGQWSDRDEGWTEVWAQLTGTTLRIWDMEVWEAARWGSEVLPSYMNVTDVFVQVLGTVTMPETSSSPVKLYTNVLILNTAGSNLLFFSCPSAESLVSWVAALRLSAWEKSRLDEIYTAHLISISNIAYDTPTSLIQGQMKGWVQIRVAGQTDWMRVWMVVSSSADSIAQWYEIGNGISSTPTRMKTRKKNMRLFSSETNINLIQLPIKSVIAMYLSNKPKDMENALLTMTDVTQAFSVYPGRPSLTGKSTLIKLEGMLGSEECAGNMRSQEAWVLVMPEFKGTMGQTQEMLKWVISLHDAFSLYGRPKSWTWDPGDSKSLMFAYPVSPHINSLFLDRELVEALDPNNGHTSAIRSRLLSIVLECMRGDKMRPLLQALPNPSGGLVSSETPDALAPQLPPLNFGFSWAADSDPSDSTALMPIIGALHLGPSPPPHLIESTEPVSPTIPSVSSVAKQPTTSIDQHPYGSTSPETNEWKSQGEDMRGESSKTMTRSGGELKTRTVLFDMDGSIKRQNSAIIKEMEERPGYGPLLYLLKTYRETQATTPI